MVCARKNRSASKGRKNRKNTRKNTRKNRRNTRRANMYGGAYDASKLSLLQGEQYAAVHRNQHGGGSWTGAGAGAPVGYDSRLPQELVASARVGPTLSALQEVSGMRDDGPGSVPSGAPGAVEQSQQTGGGRRRRRSTKRKASRKGRKATRGRRMRGGAYANPEFAAPLSAPSMLLSPAQAYKAGTADFSNPLLKN